MDQAALLALLIFMVIVIAYQSSRHTRANELGSVDSFTMGRYLAGFPETSEPIEKVECHVNNASFSFIRGDTEEVGRIPRDSINEIFYEEKDHLLGRLTSTRNLSFSAFKLSDKKLPLHKEHCLVIDWDDRAGTRRNAIFEFTGIKSDAYAFRVMQKLREYQQPHASRLRADEKKCPLCAEVIKRDALYCRFCQQRIS